MPQDLIVTILPTGSVRLEQQQTDAPIDTSRSLLQNEISRRYADHPDDAFLYLCFCPRAVALSPSLDYIRGFCGHFGQRLSKTPELETLREEAHVELTDGDCAHWLEQAPPMIGGEYLSVAVLETLWRRLHDEFANSVAHYEGSVEAFIQSYSPDVHLVGRVFFHLVESKKDDYPFAFLATYSTGLNKQGESRHLPLRHALESFGKDGRKMLELLSTVHRAAKESPLVAGLLESGELFHPLAWSIREAHAFLREIPIYEQAGILCRIPDWWKGGKAPLRVEVTLGARTPSHLGMDALLSFDIGLVLGDAPISLKEASALLASTDGLALIKNRWVAVDHEKLKQTLDAYNKAKKLAKKEGISFREAMRLQLNPSLLTGAASDTAEVAVTNGQWLESVLAKMRSPETIDQTNPGPGFTAELRPYQRRGVAWLTFLNSLGFGMCLADDMGLGKTVQVIALLHGIKTRGTNRASLLVIPASLLANWGDELTRFAPDMRSYIAHASGKNSSGGGQLTEAEIDGYDLVITTYAMAQRYEWLRDHAWNCVILDEAQAIKNPTTKQTKAVKHLRSENRIAMTGTPVENRLSDLWSLFDFINPGLLGNAQEFTAFTKRLNNDHDGYARLRKVISPYILRRLKTDKSVIADLPDKVEMKTWATLGRKQALLYKQLVDEVARMIETTEAIQRRGIILSALMKFKQICNHPDHYTGTGMFDEADSGKFERLREVCETISEKRERVLVFTQFREMIAPLDAFLHGVFGRRGLTLHGGTPVGKRKEIVSAFQAEEYVPYLALTVKAGGVGLNLTAANHVIHFDRWWNPAVENQATDRAFRIGQKKNVLVHKFITKGTVEEKIDRMIEDKVKLSNDVIQSGGEAWITELSNNELIDLFTLRL